MSTLSPKAIASMKAAPGTLASALEDVRLRILSAIDARQVIERAPVDADQANERVRTWAEGLRRDTLNRLGAERFASAHYRPPSAAEALDLILASLTPAVERELAPHIERYCNDAKGIETADRGERLTRADAEILELELLEEALIRAAEAHGLAILRRADADPRAVLAHAVELP